MKLFIGILLAATIIGGFAGGEITDTSFSIVGAVIGGVSTAAILLGLGAYFTSQEHGKPQPELTPEMRAVFDRMVTGKGEPTPAEIRDAKKHILQNSKPESKHSKSNNEVTITLNALAELKLEYDDNSSPFSMVEEIFKEARTLIRADKQDVIEGISKEGRDPKEIALTGIWNITNQQLSSGHNHVYRGVLSDTGKAYLWAFNRTVDLLLQHKFIDQKEADANRDDIGKSIKAVG